MDTITEQGHTGPVDIRGNREGGFTVLCPYGHMVTRISTAPRDWAGSNNEAVVVGHQSGRKPWITTCYGTLPQSAVSA